ncbi:hypothetical protein PR003_g6034 [Phytophthora rubi]|uniref:Uncharacterized protein n=1 Tax=Phytophthora rubi TaxID=129364 RepID=A0A6A3N562_9STRA|nr:hypothetical protein PR002_g5810 [Phytophthora rubi]KAE9044142.1 hypothetical protein PR001_g5485 [Phytophthora rubi]KAE9349155.1 hypothetical protein PR003_g6034 [Phytophthora rubi]
MHYASALCSSSLCFTADSQLIPTLHMHLKSSVGLLPATAALCTKIATYCCPCPPCSKDLGCWFGG